ncbi:hypothetical protein [Paracoccus sp. 22332]|uniref:hypothetical protein n=1 Tax=Paracoccus sp. 22332 TaxID=3453913 RepID=UPI003F872AA6
MTDPSKRKPLSLPDRASVLRYIIRKWNPPIPGCAASSMWISEDEIEFLKDTVKVLDAFAFYGADDFVRREAEKRRKGKGR